MSQCVIEIEADRIEAGELVRTSPGGPVHQTVRLFDNGRCVCRLQVVYLAGPDQAGSVRFVNGREAGERD